MASSVPATGIAMSAPRTPASCAPISTAQQDGKRRELHRPSVDERLEYVVLELLVGEEEADDDEACAPSRSR